jgi:hypothetical protein
LQNSKSRLPSLLLTLWTTLPLKIPKQIVTTQSRKIRPVKSKIKLQRKRPNLRKQHNHLRK